MSANTWAVSVTPYRAILALLVVLVVWAFSRKSHGDYDMTGPLYQLGALVLVCVWILAGMLT